MPNLAAALKYVPKNNFSIYKDHMLSKTKLLRYDDLVDYNGRDILVSLPSKTTVYDIR